MASVEFTANLILAARDMYEVLEFILDEGWLEGPYEGQQTCKDKVYAALALARGEPKCSS